MDQQRLDNFRKITPAEIEEWCEGKYLAEIQEALARDNAHLREAIDIGVDDLPHGRGENAVEDVLVSKLEQIDAQAATEEATATEQREAEEAREARVEARGRCE